MSAFSESEFVDAAACGDLDGIRALLAASDPPLPADVINKLDKDGKSAFHYACLNDDANLLRILLADPRVDVRLMSKHGDTALHMAALYAAQEAIVLLSSDGRLSLNAQNKYGETPLHLCAGSGDKAAAKTANLLLSLGASLAVPDKWGRGALDVSHDNAENPIVATLTSYLHDRSRCSEEQSNAVIALTAAYKAETARQNQPQDGADIQVTAARNKVLAQSLFSGGIGGLGGVKLKKTNTVLKTMFKADEGIPHSGLMATATVPSDGRKALSKLVDFPGDLEEIKAHLQHPEAVNPAGKDSFGLTALHKFASWNKTEYIDLIIPCLSREDLETKCPEGKTALYYAVEMAAVASVKTLVAAGASPDAVDKNGRSIMDVLTNAEPSGIIDRLKQSLITS